MFEYCVKRLHLSESAAYRRIHVARAARRLPVLLEWLAAGRVHLSGLSMLVPHLDADTCEAVLGRAEHKSKRELEELVAELAPRPDIPSRVRKLPQPKRNSSIAAPSPALEPPPTSVAAPEPGPTSLVFAATSPALEPSPPSAAAPESRAASATFTDDSGRRCEATGFLEFHHCHPYALGGPATVGNIALLCSAHNGLVAERELGRSSAQRSGGAQIQPSSAKGWPSGSCQPSRAQR